jgi:hypothetical protein
VPEEKSETREDASAVVLPELPKPERCHGIAIKGTSMPFVKCSVDGCTRKLQPILKVDPRDRDTWFYQECDVCLKPFCEKHSSEEEGRIVCDRCRREAQAKQQSAGLIDLGVRLRRDAE